MEERKKELVISRFDSCVLNYVFLWDFFRVLEQRCGEILSFYMSRHKCLEHIKIPTLCLRTDINREFNVQEISSVCPRTVLQKDLLVISRGVG